MATSKKLTGKKSKDPTSFVEVTHVSLSVRQVSGEVKKIRGICGHGLEQPLANYDPDTQSWKMYGDISLWGDCPLLVNLPVSGMTQNGVLFLQHPWEPITGETESLSWPTPTAVTRPMEGNVRMYRAKIEAGEMTEMEAEAILGKSVWEAQGAIPMMWPTPTTQEVEHPEAELTETGRRKSKNGNTSHSLGLADAVQMWPTPTAHPDNSNKNGKFKNPTLGDAVREREIWLTPVASDAWTGDLKSTQQTEGSRHSLNLSTAVQKWPTPTASDWKGRGPNSKQQGLSEVVKYPTPQARDYKGPSGRSMKGLEKDLPTAVGSGGRLNPTWVEWLMGFPTGWTDLED
jgi:hypothetical protein